MKMRQNQGWSDYDTTGVRWSKWCSLGEEVFVFTKIICILPGMAHFLEFYQVIFYKGLYMAYHKYGRLLYSSNMAFSKYGGELNILTGSQRNMALETQKSTVLQHVYCHRNCHRFSYVLIHCSQVFINSCLLFFIYLIDHFIALFTIATNTIWFRKMLIEFKCHPQFEKYDF